MTTQEVTLKIGTPDSWSGVEPAEWDWDLVLSVLVKDGVTVEVISSSPAVSAP